MTVDRRHEWVQILRSAAGVYHLAADDRRACELLEAPDRDTTPTEAELETLPPDVPAAALCRTCFELGRGA